MSKELTNRQLAEALGYALEKAESNLNDSVKKLEEERKRIESFSIDTNKVSSLFEQANKSFEKTTKQSIDRLQRIQNNRPKEVQVKEWIFYCFMILATLGSISLAVLAIINKNEAVDENKKLKETITYVNQYFNENPKQKEMFDKFKK